VSSRMIVIARKREWRSHEHADEAIPSLWSANRETGMKGTGLVRSIFFARVVSVMGMSRGEFSDFDMTAEWKYARHNFILFR